MAAGSTYLSIAYRKVRETLISMRTAVRRVRARRNQARYVGKTIAITGSVGKTTATLLTRQLLAADHAIAASEHARNSGGATLELLSQLSRPTDYVVQEVAAFPVDHYETLLKTIEIDVAVVTTIGLDHASHFRTEDGVAQQKGRLVERVRAGGVACLNADDPRCRSMASRTRERVVLYGRAQDAEVRAEAIDASWPNRMSFDLVIGGVRRRVQTRLVGTLFLPSVLAALAVVHALGVDLDAAIARLATVEPYARRLSVVEHPAGHTFALDTYKASYWSTLALVDDLENWGPARRIFVLGEMSDIANDSSRRYRQIMRSLSKRCDLVIGIGRAESAARRLPELANVVPAATVAEVRQILEQQPPSLVILKSNKTVPLDALAKRRPKPQDSDPPSGDAS